MVRKNEGSTLSSKNRVSGNKCIKNDSPEDAKNVIKTQKNKKTKLLGYLSFVVAKKEPPKVFFTFLDSFPDSFLGVCFVTLFDLRMHFSFFFGGGGGGASVPAAVRSILEPFSNYCSRKNVLPTWKLIFQPELSSNAGKTSFFDLKKQGFHFPIFFMFFRRLQLFVLFLLEDRGAFRHL